MIPKKIFCTHTSRHSLEPKLKFCVQIMEEMHPDWEFQFFSDGDCQDFIKKETPEFEELYNWYPRSVMKADLFRLLVVWRFGGFYLDTDLLLKKPLDPLCDHSVVFAYEYLMDHREFDKRYPLWMRTREKNLTLANYAFGSESRHPFISAILSELIYRTQFIEVENVTDMDVIYSTGPDAVTTVYYREQEKWADVNLLEREDVDLPEGPTAGLGNYGIHLVHGSWRHGGSLKGPLG